MELLLSDPREIHALAHPVRLAILDVLREREEATATDCAAVIAGESVQSCAYHLRTLGKLGVVEETSTSDRRKRVWRLRYAGFSVPKQDAASPMFREAWAALRGRVVERDVRVLRDFIENEEAFTPAQHRASTIRNLTLHATPDELARLADEVSDLLRPYTRDAKSERPEGAERVHVSFWVLPRRDASLP
jgi:DNA-binding transcriptional ArsR family regulator